MKKVFYGACVGLLTMASMTFRQTTATGVKESGRVIDPIAIVQYENVVPVVIIGSGPAGLGAALHAARDNKRPVVIEGDEPGGQLVNTGEVENWLGMPTLVGSAAIDMATQQVARYGAKFLHDTVVVIDTHAWPFKVELGGGMILHALTIVVATGAKPRVLGVPGEQESWEHGLSTCALCDAWACKDKNVVVVGGGESAIEEAIQLSQHAKNVTILVRGDRMRATAHSQERLRAYPTITVIYNTVVQEFMHADNGSIAHVRVLSNGVSKLMPITKVFLAIGHIPNTGLFKGILALDEEGYLVLNGRTQETSVAGIFAAGDVADKVYRQATYAAGTGVAAGIEVSRYLDEIGFTPAVIEALEQSARQRSLRESLVNS